MTLERLPWLSLLLATLITAGFVLLVPGGVPSRVWAAVAVGGALPVFAYMALGDSRWTSRAASRTPAWVAAVPPAATLGAAALYATLVGAAFDPFRWAVLAVSVVGSAAAFWHGRGRSTFLATDALAVLLVWMPVELKLLPHLPMPPSGRSLLNAALLPIVPFFVAELLFVRRWKGLGFDLYVTRRMAVTAAIAFAAFAAVAIPAALATGFARPSTSYPPPLELFGRAIFIWAFIALPEELLFRGVIQNGLTKRLGSPVAALAIASVIFGAAHLNNPPNVWHYAALATLAGVAYGWTYLRTGSTVAASLVHCAVDWVWTVFFAGAR